MRGERKARELDEGGCVTFMVNGKKGSPSREFYARVVKRVEGKQPSNPSLKVQILKFGYVESELVLGGGTEIVGTVGPLF